MRDRFYNTLARVLDTIQHCQRVVFCNEHYASRDLGSAMRASDNLACNTLDPNVSYRTVFYKEGKSKASSSPLKFIKLQYQWIALLAILFSPVPALAQGSVQQSGNVTTQHVGCWAGNTVLKDCGSATIPYPNNFGLYANGGLPFCIVASSASQLAFNINLSPYTSLCLYSNLGSTSGITLNSYNGASAANFNININGTNYAFPSGGAGTGNVTGPSTSVVGDAACFNSTNGQLLSDCGFATPLANIAALRANTKTLSQVFIQGYYTAGAPGGGTFLYVSSDTSSSDNGCTIFVDASSHRFYRILDSTNTLNAYDCGFVGGGGSHPVSSYFANLAAAQAIYPFVVATTDQMDGVAIQAALYVVAPYYGETVTESPYQYGGTVFCPAVMWRFNETIFLPPQTALIGLGSGLNPQALPSPVSGASNVQTCLGYWVGSATTDNTGGAAIHTLNAYQSVVPSFSGAISSATSTTLVFNASSVAGIGNSTFVGAILSIDSQLRVVGSGSYSAPNYTATIGNPWTTIPSSGDSLMIAAEAAGAPYTGIDSLAGNCLNYAFSYDNGIRVENIALATDNETPIGFDFQCASNAKVKNTQTSGFNAGRQWDESYYFNDENAFDVSRQDDVVLSGGTWGTFINSDLWPLTIPSSSPVDIYRPSATDRFGVVAAEIANGNDPGYYIETGFYGVLSGTVTITGGDPGETSDRGVFATGASGKLNLNGAYFERQGLYPIGGPAKTGVTGLWQNGADITAEGTGWFRSHSGGDHLVPLYSGCSPILTVYGTLPSVDDAGDPMAAPTFGYNSTSCAGLDTFDFQGTVSADVGVYPTTGDSPPYNVDSLGNITPAIFSWARYQNPVPTSASATFTLNACSGNVGVETFSNTVTVTLPATVYNGQTCTIFDGQNSAATHNITITSQTGFFNNGSGASSATMKITTNDGEAIVQSLGPSNGWNVVLQR